MYLHYDIMYTTENARITFADTARGVECLTFWDQGVYSLIGFKGFYIQGDSKLNVKAFREGKKNKNKTESHRNIWPETPK